MAKTLKRLVAKPVHRVVKHRERPAVKRAPRKKEREMTTPKQLTEEPKTQPVTVEPGVVAPLYGNENYVSDHIARGRSEKTPTQEEWLAEAKEAEAVLMRGDHVSPELIERLFLDSIPVIEGFTPVGRGKKKEGGDTANDDDDQDKKNRG
jgi:hypothetical protein